MPTARRTPAASYMTMVEDEDDGEQAGAHAMLDATAVAGRRPAWSGAGHASGADQQAQVDPVLSEQETSTFRICATSQAALAP